MRNPFTNLDAFLHLTIFFFFSAMAFFGMYFSVLLVIQDYTACATSLRYTLIGPLLTFCSFAFLATGFGTEFLEWYCLRKLISRIVNFRCSEVFFYLSLTTNSITLYFNWKKLGLIKDRSPQCMSEDRLDHLGWLLKLSFLASVVF